MLSRFGFGEEAITASGSDADLAVFLEKEAEETDPKKGKKTQRQTQKADEDLPKLFMELKWPEQRKVGQKAPVLRQVEGDSINQRIRLYRRTIFFHIHGKNASSCLLLGYQTANPLLYVVLKPSSIITGISLNGFG